MNRIVLIGNGFDLAHGRVSKTKKHSLYFHFSPYPDMLLVTMSYEFKGRRKVATV